MGSKPKKHMPVSERAKQFSPFAAVTGLEKALAAEERAMLRKEKLELSEDGAEELNKALSELKKGDRVIVEYYYDGEYLTVEGKIDMLDKVHRVLAVEETKIGFDELYRLTLIKV